MDIFICIIGTVLGLAFVGWVDYRRVKNYEQYKERKKVK